MLSEEMIQEYIKSIPPIPEVVKECIDAINEGDLVKAALIASEDRALMTFLHNIVNKPIFGFRTDVKDAKQIFGVLGLSKAKQIIFSYYVLLLVPKSWEVFDFNSLQFQDFQARLIQHWEKILNFLKIEDRELANSITIIPASLIVCEMLFRPINETVRLLLERKNMSYEAILEKMTGKTLFQIASLIAKDWGFSQKVRTLIDKLSKDDATLPQDERMVLEYMRLLLIFEMSRPVMMQSGLSQMFELELPEDENITERFYSLMSE